MISSGLDRLLREQPRLTSRPYGVLSHAAATTSDFEPVTTALARGLGAPPSVLFAPEHGFFAVEQDMVPAADQSDPFTGIPTLSLYGSSVDSLRPQPEAFAGIEVLVIDLVDIGTRYYTYAATALWAAEVALSAGVEVWILDRPNPLGGLEIEGNLPEPGFESFVGAFRLPVRHGLTLGELALLEADRRGWAREGLRIWELEGWRREPPASDDSWSWRAPSPNMPSLDTAWVYPGSCLLEATELSEGRGTTRPFELIGGPGLDGAKLSAIMNDKDLPGVRYLPVQFRPQFQKQRDQVCSGVEIVVTDSPTFESYRSGVELIAALWFLDEGGFAWRSKAYEFVVDRPAIDLLTGTDRFRQALASGDVADWIGSWGSDEDSFREERRPFLIYG